LQIIYEMKRNKIIDSLNTTVPEVKPPETQSEPAPAVYAVPGL